MKSTPEGTIRRAHRRTNPATIHPAAAPIVNNRPHPKSLPITDNRLDPKAAPLADHRPHPKSLPIVDDGLDPKAVPLANPRPHSDGLPLFKIPFHAPSVPVMNTLPDPRSVPIVKGGPDPQSEPLTNNLLDPRALPIVDSKLDPQANPLPKRRKRAKRPKRTPAEVDRSQTTLGRRPRRRELEEPAEPADPFLGRVLDGTYRIDRVIGAGGMAVVYGATDLSLDRQVAIKILSEKYCREPKYRRRFRIEAKTAAKIQHPNLVQIYGCRTDDDTIPYIVMELLVGRDLQEEANRVGRMPWTRAVALMIQICGAVEAAHRQGVIHRDIKPANCFLLAPRPRDLLGGERIKLLDLGIAKLMTNHEVTETTTPKTVEGAILGTWPYMAPEQIEQEPVPQTDVYALGAVLYRLITGRHPIRRDGASDRQLVFRILNEIPAAPSRLIADLPPRLSALIQQTLSKSITDRPQSVAGLRSALVDCLRFAAAKNVVRSETTTPQLPRLLFFGTAVLSSLGLVASLLMLVHLSRPARAARPLRAVEATATVIDDTDDRTDDGANSGRSALRRPKHRAARGDRELGTEQGAEPVVDRTRPPVIEAPSLPASASPAPPTSPAPTSKAIPDRREQRRILQRELRKQNGALTSACPINFRIKTELLVNVDIKIQRGRATVTGVSASPSHDIMSCINNQLQGRVIPDMVLGGRYSVKLTLHGQ